MKYSSQTTSLMPKEPSPYSGEGIKEWLKDAQRPVRSHLMVGLDVVGDLFVCSFWICVLIYGSLISTYDGHRVEDIPFDVQKLIEVGRYASTLFPILFAATVGKCLKDISFWRLRRGERIGILDQLLGSTSVVNTLMTQFHLRSFGALGVSLVMIWSLSPLGSQASLRAPSIGTLSSSINITLPYLSMENDIILELRVGSHGSHQRVPPQAAYLTSLLSGPAVKESPRDDWGNLKIPFLDGSTDPVDGRVSEWSPVQWNEQPTIMRSSSLLGIPVGELPNEGNTKFNLQSSYFDLNCPVITNCTLDNCQETDLYFDINATPNAIGDIVNVWYEDYTERKPSDTNLQTPPKKLLFKFEEYWGPLYSLCEIRTTYVEMRVSCVGIECTVTHIQNSTLTHPPRAWTYFDSLPLTLNEFIFGFTSAISGRPNWASPLTNFFTDPGYPFNGNIGAESLATTTTPTSFSRSLSQLFNTYWIASIGEKILLQGQSYNWLEAPPSSSSQADFVRPRLDSTTGTVETEHKILVCNRGWLTALLIASLSPLLAGILCLVLHLLPSSLGPILSMNISTMIRDNPYVDIPPGGSTLDDVDRSRLLRDVKVRLGDVAPAAEIGHIAIGSLSGDKGVVTRLNNERLYD